MKAQPRSGRVSDSSQCLRLTRHPENGRVFKCPWKSAGCPILWEEEVGFSGIIYEKENCHSQSLLIGELYHSSCAIRFLLWSVKYARLSSGHQGKLLPLCKPSAHSTLNPVIFAMNITIIITVLRTWQENGFLMSSKEVRKGNSISNNWCCMWPLWNRVKVEPCTSCAW